MHSAHEKRSGHTKKRQGYPDVLCYARRYTRSSTPVLAGQGAAAAAKLSHDETKGNSVKASSAGCHTAPGCIFTAWVKSV